MNKRRDIYQAGPFTNTTQEVHQMYAQRGGSLRPSVSLMSVRPNISPLKK